jgi:beta-N-acetylglucosaminidase
MPGEFHCLDKDHWTEIPDRNIIKGGTTYVGKDYIPDENGNPTYEVRVYIRKL